MKFTVSPTDVPGKPQMRGVTVVVPHLSSWHPETFCLWPWNLWRLWSYPDIQVLTKLLFSLSSVASRQTSSGRPFGSMDVVWLPIYATGWTTFPWYPSQFVTLLPLFFLFVECQILRSLEQGPSPMVCTAPCRVLEKKNTVEYLCHVLTNQFCADRTGYKLNSINKIK